MKESNLGGQDSRPPQEREERKFDQARFDRALHRDDISPELVPSMRPEIEASLEKVQEIRSFELTGDSLVDAKRAMRMLGKENYFLGIPEGVAGSVFLRSTLEDIKEVHKDQIFVLHSRGPENNFEIGAEMYHYVEGQMKEAAMVDLLERILQNWVITEEEKSATIEFINTEAGKVLDEIQEEDSEYLEEIEKVELEFRNKISEIMLSGEFSEKVNRAFGQFCREYDLNIERFKIKIRQFMDQVDETRRRIADMRGKKDTLSDRAIVSVGWPTREAAKKIKAMRESMVADVKALHDMAIRELDRIGLMNKRN